MSDVIFSPMPVTTSLVVEHRVEQATTAHEPAARVAANPRGIVEPVEAAPPVSDAKIAAVLAEFGVDWPTKAQ